MSARVSRRRALQLGVGTLGYLFTGPAFSVAQVPGANGRLRVAGIGVGGKGGSDIDQAAKVFDVAAVCDIDEERLGVKAKLYSKAATYFDYRKLFDQSGKEIDAVVVSTPDHHHALASLLAIQMGKHVYCQKPLTHTPAEARMLREAAAKMKVVTQMGNQGSGLSGLRRAVELVRAGVIGDVTEAHVWTNRPFKYWKQSPDIVKRPEESAVPKHVHWDEWIGPSPFRPFAIRPDGEKTKPAYHPHDWRGYWDFGTGALGDMACHTANMPYRALELDTPTAVVAEAGEINGETFPAWAKIAYHFPARGKRPACVLHWYEGADNGKRVLPADEIKAKVLGKGESFSDSGSLLVGTKGILFAPNDYAADFRLLPEKEFEGVKRDKPEKGPEGVAKDQDPFMKQEWADAIKAGKPEMASSSFEIAGRLTETMLLGNIAVRFAGKKLMYDAAKMEFTGNADASKLVRVDYRKGWELPKV
jgi:predicted dehydrogenase